MEVFFESTKIRSTSGAFVDVTKSGEPQAIITGRTETSKAARELILNVLYPNRGKVCHNFYFFFIFFIFFLC